MKNIGLAIIRENLNQELNDLQTKVRYNKSKIMKRAMYLYRTKVLTWSEALKLSWSESKSYVSKKRNELASVTTRMVNLLTQSLNFRM